ncbi:MAG TPA: hypothetical protein VNA22_01000 [Pyrinomonadaceae bacterium]|nr:hypothetical protein [Pyrinomonadaceae bacterium]
MHGQIAFFDEASAPYMSEEFVLCDDFARSFYEVLQDVKGSCREVNELTIFENRTFGRV